MLAHRRSSTASAAVFAIVSFFGACSNVPPATWPAFAEHHVAAEFVVPADGLLPMPLTSWSLVVRELTAEPAPHGERFEGGRRWFVYPAGTSVRRLKLPSAFRRHSLRGAAFPPP